MTISIPRYLRVGEQSLSSDLWDSFLWPDEADSSPLAAESVRHSRILRDLVRLTPWGMIAMGDMYVAFKAGATLQPILYFLLLGAQSVLFPGMMGLLAGAGAESQFEVLQRSFGIENLATAPLLPEDYAHGVLFRPLAIHALGNSLAAIGWMAGGGMILVHLAMAYSPANIGMRLLILAFLFLIGGLFRFSLLRACLVGGGMIGLRAALMIPRGQRSGRIIGDWLLTWALTPALILGSLGALYAIFSVLLPILIVPPLIVAIVVSALLPRMIERHALELGTWTLRESRKWWLRNPEDPDWVPVPPPRWWEPVRLVAAGLLRIQH